MKGEAIIDKRILVLVYLRSIFKAASSKEKYMINGVEQNY